MLSDPAGLSHCEALGSPPAQCEAGRTSAEQGVRRLLKSRPRWFSLSSVGIAVASLQ